MRKIMWMCSFIIIIAVTAQEWQKRQICWNFYKIPQINDYIHESFQFIIISNGSLIKHWEMWTLALSLWPSPVPQYFIEWIFCTQIHLRQFNRIFLEFAYFNLWIDRLAQLNDFCSKKLNYLLLVTRTSNWLSNSI